ncbi:unnamed protein product, partial [Hapterophycus canaliculatus]
MAGDAAGRVTVSDINLSSKVQRQAYSGPVLALVLAPEGALPGSGTSRAYPLSSNNASHLTSAGGAAPNENGNDKKNHGIVVTLGDDSVVPPPQSVGIGNPLIGGGGAAAGGNTANLGGGGSVGGGGGNGRSPCVLKFWAGADMAVCIRAVDVAAQMRDGQQQRWATGGGAGGRGGEGGGGGPGMGVPRLTAFAAMPDASQVACGFSDGTALLLQGDLARSPLLPPPAPLLIQPGEENPSAVTALHFSKGRQGRGGGGSGGGGSAGASFAQAKLLVGYDLDGGSKNGGDGGGGGGGIPPFQGSNSSINGSLGLLSYDTRTDAEPLVLDEVGCGEGCSAFGQSTQ